MAEYPVHPVEISSLPNALIPPADDPGNVSGNEVLDSTQQLTFKLTGNDISTRRWVGLGASAQPPAFSLESIPANTPLQDGVVLGTLFKQWIAPSRLRLVSYTVQLSQPIAAGEIKFRPNNETDVELVMSTGQQNKTFVVPPNDGSTDLVLDAGSALTLKVDTDAAFAPFGAGQDALVSFVFEATP